MTDLLPPPAPHVHVADPAHVRAGSAPHVRSSRHARAAWAPHVRGPSVPHVRTPAPYVPDDARAAAAPHVPAGEPHVRTEPVKPQVTHVRDGEPHVRDDAGTHVRDLAALREAVAARARAMAADPHVCTFCGEQLTGAARADGFCDRTCEKRHRWIVLEDRVIWCRTCDDLLPDSVIQRRGQQCPTCRRGERGASS